jgi:hypothetical protein
MDWPVSIHLSINISRYEYREQDRAQNTHTGHLNPAWTSAVSFRLLAKEEHIKQSECGALVEKGHIRNPRYRLRPLAAAPLVVRRRCLTVGP